MEKIIEGCSDSQNYTHIDYEPIPSVESAVEILDRLREIIFPGYFSRSRLNPVNLKYSMGQSVSIVYEILADQIANSIRHDCYRYQRECSNCREQGQSAAIKLLEKIPKIRNLLFMETIARGGP